MKSSKFIYFVRSATLIIPVFFLFSAHAQFGAPVVTVPAGELPPGPWPTILSAANVDINTEANSILGGTGSDNLRVSFPQSGPIPWTESRHNEGDVSMCISPIDAATEQPPFSFLKWQPTTGATTHAWRVNKYFGIALATVRVNGRDNGDMTDSGFPVGTIYGITYFNADFGQGQSYGMLDGAYGNGGNGAQDLQMGLAGMANISSPHTSDGEGSFSVAAAYFPFVQKWIGAHVLGSAASIGPSGEASFDGDAYSPVLNTNVVNWVINPGSGLYDNGHARIVLPMGDPSKGLLFGSATEGDNNIHNFGAYPNSGGWDITVRNGEDLDATGTTLTPVEKMSFVFIYIPTNTCGLIGGHIDGTSGASFIHAGSFTMNRTAAGNYELTIPGKTGADGMLILTVAGKMAGTTSLADRTFLSYEYVGGKFVIQSREVVAGGNTFGLSYVQRDSDFVFAFIDFRDPMIPRYQEGPTPDAASGGTAPGAFPNTSVSAANVDVNTEANSILGGTGSDNLRVSFPQSGPFRWTESRHNEGDISMCVNPIDQSTELPPFSFLKWQPTSGASTHDWRVNKFFGLALASVRVNGRDNGDMTDSGFPVGTVYGITYFNADFGQGQSYGMVDGAYGNGGNGAQDLQMGLAGMANIASPHTSDGEGSFSVAAAYFPYAQSWVGAHVLGSTPGVGPNGEASFDIDPVNGNAFSPLLRPKVVNWVLNPNDSLYDYGHARIVMPGADYNPSTALLFGSATEGDNNIRNFGAYPNNGGWDVTIRNSEDLDVTGQTLTPIDKMSFMFLCIPTNTPGLIGGHINGTSGAAFIQAGTFTLTRTAAGNYELTIPGKTGADGMLLLTVAGQMSGTTDLADRTFLSYEYVGGKFVIQSREVVSGGNTFGLSYVQRDTDFVFAFVDFANPLSTVVAPSVAPSLQIVGSGGNATISWPNTAFCYVLESTSSLTAPSWTQVTATATVVGTQKILTLPIGSVPQFFRLHKQ